MQTLTPPGFITTFTSTTSIAVATAITVPASTPFVIKFSGNNAAQGWQGSLGLAITSATSKIIFAAGQTNPITVQAAGATNAALTYTIPEVDIASPSGPGTGTTAADVMITTNTVPLAWTGTFTPTFGDQNAGSGLFTLTTAVGYYSRIGDSVFFSAYVVWSNKNSATGTNQVWLMSLPFTSVNTANFHAPVTIGLILNVAFAGMLVAYIPVDTTRIEFLNITDAGAQTAGLVSSCSATGQIMLSGYYRTA